MTFEGRRDFHYRKKKKPNHFDSACCKYHRKEQKLTLTMRCEEVGVKKKTTISYTYSKTSQQHQRETRHVLPRGVCLRSKSSLWCVGLQIAWRNALLPIPRSSHTFLFTPQTPPLFHQPYMKACWRLERCTALRR